MKQLSRDRGAYPKMSLKLPENGSQQIGRFFNWVKCNAKSICNKFHLKQLNGSQEIEEHKKVAIRKNGQ